MPSDSDPICKFCCEPRSAHVPTDDGPLTCPRVARGEGVYVLDRPGYTTTMGCWPGEEIEVPETYKFVPSAKLENPYGHGWSPTS